MSREAVDGHIGSGAANVDSIAPVAPVAPVERVERVALRVAQDALRITRVLAGGERLAARHRRELRVLELPYAGRSRSRLRTRAQDGGELHLFLPRGTVLREGSVLIADDGSWLKVRAAPEAVLEARCADPLLLARAAYHLGNRHTAVQIEAGRLRLLPDPVLAQLLRRLGLEVHETLAPFEPEAGAYGGGHHHGHDETFDEDHALARAAFVHHHGESST